MKCNCRCKAGFGDELPSRGEKIVVVVTSASHTNDYWRRQNILILRLRAGLLRNRTRASDEFGGRAASTYTARRSS